MLDTLLPLRAANDLGDWAPLPNLGEPLGDPPFGEVDPLNDKVEKGSFSLAMRSRFFTSFSRSISDTKFLLIRVPSLWSLDYLSPIIDSTSSLLLDFWTKSENEIPFMLYSPVVNFLKKSVIAFVLYFLSEFLMISRNSSNSISPEPSASTASTNCYTFSSESANPKPINGSWSSSVPIEPPPS
jgi:hypothetical protein